MLDTVDTIPWSRLRHCRGRATDVPDILRGLGSEDEDIREEAINDGLWDRLCHQHCLFPASAFVIPFLIELLRDGHLQSVEARREAIRFIQVCAMLGDRGVDHGFWLLQFHRRLLAPSRPPIPMLICRGLEVFKRFAADPDDQVREIAQRLGGYCTTGPDGIAWPPLG